MIVQPVGVAMLNASNEQIETFNEKAPEILADLAKHTEVKSKKKSLILSQNSPSKSALKWQTISRNAGAAR